MWTDMLDEFKKRILGKNFSDDSATTFDQYWQPLTESGLILKRESQNKLD
jgi:hypothetical protein